MSWTRPLVWTADLWQRMLADPEYAAEVMEQQVGANLRTLQGISAPTAGDVVIASSTGGWANLAVGTSGETLTVSTDDLPAWA